MNIKIASFTVLMITCLITACDEEGKEEKIPFTEDTQRTLDLSRGDYSCFDIQTTFVETTDDGDVSVTDNVIIALDKKYAPLTSANFENNASTGFYNNIIFHSVLDASLQTGLVTPDLEFKTANAPVKSEAENGLKNYRGRISMVRSRDSSDSTGAEFLINLGDNAALDHPNLYDNGGLAVFGGVVKGMSVLDKISEQIVSGDNVRFPSLPIKNVVIDTVTGTTCPVEAEEIVGKVTVIPYPVLQTEDVTPIDLTRGDYACYQMVTSLGNIDVAIDEYYAPGTSKNFAAYVEDEFYNGLIFHRVIEDFMIQGGGFNSDLVAKDVKSPIKAEHLNGLKNHRGRLAMARTSAIDSATSQFFINLVDNTGLDYENTTNGLGYTVFGEVLNGMDIVDQIASVEVGEVKGRQNVPLLQPITIDSISTMDCPVN